MLQFLQAFFFALWRMRVVPWQIPILANPDLAVFELKEVARRQLLNPGKHRL